MTEAGPPPSDPTASGAPPELHRPVRVGRIGDDVLEVVVAPTEAERTALAERMGLPAIVALSCRFALVRRSRATVAATGHLTATVVQTCVVSLEDFEARIVEDFTVHFVPAGTENEDPDPESVDEIPYTGDTIDVGEATAEQLALSLDPYPRRPGAQLPAADTGTTDPRLAALAAWRGGRNGSQDGSGGGGVQ